MTSHPPEPERAAHRWTFLVLAALSGVTGCNAADLTVPLDVKDAEVCADAAVVYCEAGAPTDPGCSAQPDAASSIPRGLASGARYPVGCAASRVVSLAGECAVAETCRCADDDAGPGWRCDLSR